MEAGWLNGTTEHGNGVLQIVLRSASGSTIYCRHMHPTFVRGGQRVETDDVIDTMGDTGSPGAVHRHFEYRKSGRVWDAITPAAFFRRHGTGSHVE